MNEHKWHQTSHRRGGVNIDLHEHQQPVQREKLASTLFSELVELADWATASAVAKRVTGLPEDVKVSVYEAEIAARQAMIALHADDLAHRAADVDPLAEFLNAPAVEDEYSNPASRENLYYY